MTQESNDPKICRRCLVLKDNRQFRRGRNVCKTCTRSPKADQLKPELDKARSVLLIGDLHTPFQHLDAWDFLGAVQAKYKPTEAVSLGDEIDACALSAYVKDPDGMSAGDEHEAALQELEPLKALFPQLKICKSNHTERPFKLAYRAGIPAKFLKDYAELLEAPYGWQWADHWDIGDFRCEHGESFGGQTGAYRSALHNMRSTAIGHIHSHAGIAYLKTPSAQIWAMNVGCLIDEDRYAFHYAKHMKTRPWIGCALVEENVPRLIPMDLNVHKRWTGRV